MYQAVEWYFPQNGQSFDPNQYIDVCHGQYVQPPVSRPVATTAGGQPDFQTFVSAAQARLRGGTLAGADAIPDAVIACGSPDALDPGDAFACRIHSDTTGDALIVFTVTGSGANPTFTDLIGDTFGCPSLNPPQQAALVRIGSGCGGG